MKRHLQMTVVALMAVLPVSVFAQMTVDASLTISNPDNIPAPLHPVPSDRQLAWQETEFYGFFHYGMNTYTDKEWGDGSENVSTFNPTAMPNPTQWLTAAKSAGMKGGIAVVKHHDGFCPHPDRNNIICCQQCDRRRPGHLLGNRRRDDDRNNHHRPRLITNSTLRHVTGVHKVGTTRERL